VGESPLQVRYGDWDIHGLPGILGVGWIGTNTTRTVSGSIACNNATFGDPFPGRRKHCQRDESPWVYCVSENQICSFPGQTRWVKYGASWTGATGEVAWKEKQISNSVPCTNDAFGGDPHYGVVKGCWLSTEFWSPDN
jgi:hypothetical protein